MKKRKKRRKLMTKHGIKDQLWQQKISSQLTTQLHKITRDIQSFLSHLQIGQGVIGNEYRLGVSSSEGSMLTL